jgi:phosphate-selective porin OprO and OprP
VVVRPLNFEALPARLHRLGVGLSVTTGIEQEPVSPQVLRLPLQTPFFAFNPTVRADGLRNRYSPEVTYFYDGLGFAAQYYHEDQRLRPAFTGPGSALLVDVPADGFYVLATYLLTGESRTDYSQAVEPLHDFDPCHPAACPGAIELVARLSRLRLGDVVFARGPANLADPTRYTNGATELTLGFNWYFNRYVRVQFNWEHGWFDDPVLLSPGPGGAFRHQDTLVSRFQVIF